MELDGATLSCMKVKDLQRELKKRGLDTSGLKAALLKRLKEHVEQEGEQEEMPTTEPLAEEDEPQEETKEKQEEEAGRETASATEEDPAVAAVEDDTEAVDELNNGSERCDAAKDDASPAVQAEESEPASSEVPIEGSGDGNSPEAKPSWSSKRGADEVTAKEEADSGRDPKKQKHGDEDEGAESQSGAATEGNPSSPVAEGGEKEADSTAPVAESTTLKTLRIDNFVRPFTLSAVKTLVQEFGVFVEDGFWMDAIKTHCYVTYPNVESAEKTSAALDGKVWPPENGRALSVAFVDQTAMEVATSGELKVSSPSKRKASGESEAEPPRSRPKSVTIDEFFMKTETKPVLYYLPLTDEQVAEREQRKQQRLRDGPPRRRRPRGGRKKRRGGRGRGGRRRP